MFQSVELKHPRFYQVFRLFIVIFASILYAWNLRCFAKTAGLFPSGFAGASLLLQNIGIKFLHVSVPFAVFNIGLDLFPTYIAYKYIGKRFTLYSIVVILLSSIFVDILPPYVFTDDIMLISLFGGLINGLAISLCLNVGTSTGGTDFISIFLSHHDATLFKGVGCYEEKEKTLIYSVINSEAKRELIPMIRGIDEHAFINVVKTEELDGRFHDIPHD